MYSTFLTASPGSVLFSRSNLLKRKDLCFSCLRLGLIRHRRSLRSSHLFSSDLPRFSWHSLENWYLVNCNLELVVSILSKCFCWSNESKQKAIRDHRSNVEIPTPVTVCWQRWIWTFLDPGQLTEKGCVQQKWIHCTSAVSGGLTLYTSGVQVVVPLNESNWRMWCGFPFPPSRMLSTITGLLYPMTSSLLTQVFWTIHRHGLNERSYTPTGSLSRLPTSEGCLRNGPKVFIVCFGGDRDWWRTIIMNTR